MSLFVSVLLSLPLGAMSFLRPVIVASHYHTYFHFKLPILHILLAHTAVWGACGIDVNLMMSSNQSAMQLPPQ